MNIEFAETVSKDDVEKVMSKLRPTSLLQTKDCMTNYYFFRSCLSDQEIANIHQISADFPIQDGNVSGVVDKTYRSSEIKWLTRCEQTEHIYQRFIKLAKTANDNMWQFHLSSLEDDLQYTTYTADQNGHYDFHYDIGGFNSSTRKLSMVVQLTDPSDYEGGELQFAMNRSIITAPKEKGTVIFFPSYLLHKVTPVTKGKRQSLVIWFHGNPFV